ncbi:MAG TPA: helicase-related protein [Vicinamibacterales bacterium]
MPTNSIDDRETSNIGPVKRPQSLPAGITPGARVMVRGARWRVEQVVAREDCCELHVTAETGDRRQVFLWPFDRPAPAERQAPFGVVRVRAWWRNVAAAVAGEIGPFTPRARHVRADVLPYQLMPAIAMARGALRVILADEVGLGKTVQAGWIIADLVERQRDARVLIAVPAGLRRQWATELDTLFGMTATTADAAWLRATISDIPADVSPWAAPGIYLGSIDFLKRPDVGRSALHHRWDLLVVDEAHGAAAPTERHTTIGAIAAQARRVVSITATPFSGDTNAFSSIAALGDVSSPPEPPLMFRRSREDIGDRRGRRHRFVSVRISRPEFRLQRLLERYSRKVWREATGNVDGARLAVTMLRKRALSSPAAVERSLRRRLVLLKGAAAAPGQLSMFDDEDATDDDLVDSALATPGLANAEREHQWLAVLIASAAAAAGHDSKLRHLLRLRDRTRGEPAIVFTEYRDTLRQLFEAMPDCLLLHGGMTASERAAAQRRFNNAGGWLLATDAASEGLNLQQRCRLVVNYELPWNPARLEQRIGRVDRIGQQRSVHAVTLVARDTAEDLVVANLMKRLASVAATLGDRDHLASFLDAARLARTVIGGIDSDTPVAPDPPVDVFKRPPPDLPDLAARAAAEIQSRAVAAARPIRMPISAMRASRLMSSGYVIAFRCEPSTDAGQVAAERLVFVHVREGLTRPLKAGDIRSRGSQVVDAVAGSVERTVPGLGPWFDAIQCDHTSAIDALIGRETALRDVRSDASPVQRGLFDRRAEAAADHQSSVDRELRAEAADRIRDLERSRPLRRTVLPAGVLLLWR